MPFDLLFERKPPSFALQAPTGGGQLLAQLWGFAQGRQDQRILSLLLSMAGSGRVGEGAGEQEKGAGSDHAVAMHPKLAA